MVEMTRETFPKSIQMHALLPKDLWLVKADATQLSQLLLNLAVNARDAMPGGGELEFSAQNIAVSETDQARNPDAKAGPYVVIRVSDTGTGISSETLEKIFDPFFTTKPPGQGTGLGLATTQNIVKSHGGFIEVTSKLMHGTQFNIFLPAMPDAQTKSVVEERAEPPPGHGELVLIADDELLIREMTRLALESCGYRALLARDGIEAVALGTHHKEELRIAVIDTAMLFLEGSATIRALQKVDPLLRFIRISGAVDCADGTELTEPEVQAFLQKPFSAEQLLETVHEVLQT